MTTPDALRAKYAAQRLKAGMDECRSQTGSMRWAMLNDDDWRDVETLVAAALTTTPLAGEVLDERGHWQPRIGSEVRVSERYAHYGDWQRDRLWVAGIQKNRTDDGLNITVAHEWPQTMGGTDGFYINRPFKPDDLEPVNGFASAPTPSNIGDAEAREATRTAVYDAVLPIIVSNTPPVGKTCTSVAGEIADVVAKLSGAGDGWQDIASADWLPSFKTQEAVMFAISDPGRVVGDRLCSNGVAYEALSHWQARAAIKAFVQALTNPPKATCTPPVGEV